MICEAHLAPAIHRPLMPAWLLHPGWQSIFLVCFGLMIALPLLLTTLAPYDDEGYVMMTLKSFSENHPLYEETYRQYGPSFYVLTAPLHSVLGLWLLCNSSPRRPSFAPGLLLFRRRMTRGRVMLAGLTALGPWIAYPIAGTQLMLGALPGWLTIGVVVSDSLQAATIAMKSKSETASTKVIDWTPYARILLVGSKRRNRRHSKNPLRRNTL